MGGRAASVVCAGRLRPGPARYPAAGRAVPRPLRRGHPQEPLSDHRRQRRGTLPSPRPHHSGGAGLSGLRPRRRARRLQLSRAGVPLSRRPAEPVPAGRYRILWPAGSRRGRRGNAGAGAGGNLGVRFERCRNPHRRRGAVHGADRCARPVSGLAAAADQGFQPQGQPHRRHRAADAGDRPRPQRI